MKKRKLIALVSIIILLIVVASILIVVYMFDETRDLRADFLQSGDENKYVVGFINGGNTNDLAHLYFRISEEYNDENRLRIKIWHEENTNLDKLTLSFSNMISDRLMYVVPGGSWPPMEFGNTEDGGIVLDIPNFKSSLGTGTVTMDFRIIRYPGDPLEELYCYVDMQLSRDKGLKSIKYNAETYLEMTVPGDVS